MEKLRSQFDILSEKLDILIEMSTQSDFLNQYLRDTPKDKASYADYVSKGGTAGRAQFGKYASKGAEPKSQLPGQSGGPSPIKKAIEPIPPVVAAIQAEKSPDGDSVMPELKADLTKVELYKSRAATHLGNCQACGSSQKLPGDRLAKHGYTVAHGYFEGVCPGSGQLPIQVSCDYIKDQVIPSLHRSIEWLEGELVRGASDAQHALHWYKSPYGGVTSTEIGFTPADPEDEGKQYRYFHILMHGKVVTEKQYRGDPKPVKVFGESAEELSKKYNRDFLAQGRRLLEGQQKMLIDAEHQVEDWVPTERMPIPSMADLRAAKLAAPLSSSERSYAIRAIVEGSINFKAEWPRWAQSTERVLRKMVDRQILNPPTSVVNKVKYRDYYNREIIKTRDEYTYTYTINPAWKPTCLQDLTPELRNKTDEASWKAVVQGNAQRTDKNAEYLDYFVRRNYAIQGPNGIDLNPKLKELLTSASIL